MFFRFRTHSGQTLIEIVITTAIIVTAIIAILGLVTHSLVASSSSKLKTQATFLAQEGIEIVHNIRDTNQNKVIYPWDKNFYTQDGFYTLNNYDSTSGWTLTFANINETSDGTDPAKLNFDNIQFTRYIKVIKYNGEDNKRKVTVRVAWEEQVSTNEIVVSSIITDFYVVSGVCFGACDVDNDGDTYSEDEGDCDDGDPNVYPGIGDCPFTVIAVFSGNDSTSSSALKKDYTLWAWGGNTYGELGDGTTTFRFSPVPTLFTNVKSVSIGGIHTLVLKRDGTVWATGYNGWGQLGIGSFDTNPHANPIQVNSLTNVKAIAAGRGHSLAIKEDGTLWAWGLNDYGQLGIGNTNNQNVPVQVGSGTNWMAVSGGGEHTLAIKEDGTLWAWGSNGYGELGYGTYGVGTHKYSPFQISLGQVSAVSGGYWTSYALRGGIDWSWGFNWYGALGRAEGICYLGGICSIPGQVNIITEVVRISGGREHALALKFNGTVWAWGANGQGQLGDGAWNSGDNFNPRQSLVSGTIIDISAGSYHSLALRDDGTVWAWGNDQCGQLGDGDGNSTTDTPVRVPGLD